MKGTQRDRMQKAKWWNQEPGPGEGGAQDWRPGVGASGTDSREGGQRPHPQTSIMALARAATWSPLNLWRRAGRGRGWPPELSALLATINLHAPPPQETSLGSLGTIPNQ